VKFSKTIEKGIIKERLIYSTKNELNQIISCINKMLDNNEDVARRIFYTQEKLYTIELEKKQFELYFLQSQINPHFLYNTLELVRSIAECKNVPEISEIAVAMGGIFRYSINSQDMVYVSDELESIKNYFKIIAIRYFNRFSLEICCSQEIEKYKIMKMILQPIVENSIKHGIGNKKGDSKVKVSCMENNSNIVINIEDDGAGISVSKLYELNSLLDLKTPEKSTTIGLFNINRRIKNYFGEEFGLKLESLEGLGTKVIVTLPLKE
jgi:two-component system sensor histidine kinase YesM